MISSVLALVLAASTLANQEVLLRGSAPDPLSSADAVPPPAPKAGPGPPPPPCYNWKQVFPPNHVFLDTLAGTGKSVQLGYVSSIYDAYPDAYPSGLPVITLDIAQKLCDAMNTVGTFCSAFQFFRCPNPGVPGTFVTWADLLTPYEYNKYNKNSGQNINSTIVAAVAYAKVPC